MRKVIQWTLVPAAMVALACKGDARKHAAMGDALKRDLQLASSTANIKISPDEISPKSQQELALKPKKAPNAPNVIQTDNPTVRASAQPREAAEIKTDIPQVQVMAAAPAPSETPSADAPPLARPSPVANAGYPGAAAIPASSGSSGGILGGIFGAVIRGGVVGDDDHCDPRGGVRRPTGGRPIGGDVYGAPGGMGAGRTIPIIGGGGRRRP